MGRDIKEVRYSIWVALLLSILLWLVVIGGCSEAISAPPNEEEVPIDECPNGREWTTWCGCDEPVYGSDC